MENPGWYTAYTPYQAEIAQGRLEALINFQTMIIELTGMEIANASLLDEATAAAEAVSMLVQTRPKHKKEANKLLVDKSIFPQTLEVLNTRMKPVNIEIACLDLSKADLSDSSVFGVYIQYPDNEGRLMDWHLFSEKAKSNDIKIAVGTDLLALTLFTPPGDWGADVVIGTSQRLGVPMGFGGPHAAFFATKKFIKGTFREELLASLKTVKAIRLTEWLANKRATYKKRKSYFQYLHCTSTLSCYGWYVRCLSWPKRPQKNCT